MALKFCIQNTTIYLRVLDVLRLRNDDDRHFLSKAINFNDLKTLSTPALFTTDPSLSETRQVQITNHESQQSST